MSGDVAVRLPATASTSVDLRSASGPVDSGFDELTASRKPGASSMTGTLGSGDGQVFVAAVSGAVTLLRRAKDTDGQRRTVCTEEAR